MKNRLLTLGLLLAAAGASACATAPSSEDDRDELRGEVQSTVLRFKREDPGAKYLFENAYAYAVFPSIAKAAIGIGGAYGRGEVFEQNKMIGYCDTTQASIGFQLGGQAYSQVIFFEGPSDLHDFTSGDFAFAAEASAVAADAGASTNNDYVDGVMVFQMTNGGLMAEASVGGQSFGFTPVY